jgi:glutamate N-acetyltransferase / amino-acid N-acetyltransferase
MIQLRRSPEEVRLPRGFVFSSIAAGIKVSGRPDLALAEAPSGATAAALFTSNRVVAAPVTVGRKSLRATGGRVRAVIINSGNANCATGREGILGCELVCRRAAKILGAPANQIFPSSTGIIGVKFPAQKITAKLTELFAAKSASESTAESFARAIMTTDTRPKIASAELRIGKQRVTICGFAKGAGMIHPQMATMLVYLFADVSATPRELQALLRNACDESFNCISIDGDTSTNDTVLLLASGESRAGLNSAKVRKQFGQALNSICHSLAEQIM